MISHESPVKALTEAAPRSSSASSYDESSDGEDHFSYSNTSLNYDQDPFDLTSGKDSILSSTQNAC